MKAEQRRCCNCEKHFPATPDYFYTKRRTKAGAEVLDYVCKPCRVSLNRTAEAKRKARQAAEMMGPPKPTQRPVGPLTIRRQKPQPARCPVPHGVAMRSAWRATVPAGYGVPA